MDKENKVVAMDKVRKLEFEYNGRNYCLEYTPDSIKEMEAGGFRINEVMDMPQTRIEQLWTGAFLAHERRVSHTVQMEMYKVMKSRKLLYTLMSMYNNTLSNLLPDDEGDEDYMGEVKWRALP